MQKPEWSTIWFTFECLSSILSQLLYNEMDHKKYTNTKFFSDIKNLISY